MNWFTSDGHFWHRNCIAYEKRNYSMTDEGVLQMNEDMVTRWNIVVKPEDTVYYLGDFSLAHRPVEVYTRRLNGTKILVLGNHDWPHPAHKKSRNPENRLRWERQYLKWGWDQVMLEHKMRIGKDQILVRLYHMPYLDDLDPKQNHKRHRLKDDGIPLICGHVHSRWRQRFSKSATPQVNVGVDVHDFYPVSEDRIMEIFNHMMTPEYKGPDLRNLNLNEEDREEDSVGA